MYNTALNSRKVELVCNSDSGNIPLAGMPSSVAMKSPKANSPASVQRTESAQNVGLGGNPFECVIVLKPEF